MWSPEGALRVSCVRVSLHWDIFKVQLPVHAVVFLGLETQMYELNPAVLPVCFLVKIFTILLKFLSFGVLIASF